MLFDKAADDEIGGLVFAPSVFGALNVMTREIRANEAAEPIADAGSSQAPVERRRHKRFAVDGDAEVMILNGIQLFRGRIADISLSGCFIATGLHLHMKPGTPVQIVLRANRVKLQMTAKARSVRSGSGAGFVFETMSDYGRAGLERLIQELQGSMKAEVIPLEAKDSTQSAG